MLHVESAQTKNDGVVGALPSNADNVPAAQSRFFGPNADGVNTWRRRQESLRLTDRRGAEAHGAACGHSGVGRDRARHELSG
ncbi:hypothetical protein [Leucobacter sp. G161]|uniref:hypothetical protein n=1 Tax=Leucobacter sp. G161 TaxID=663704 RepID=UPI00128F076E|nr:hypothetical protein [Leucobacter sp. G161]